MSSTSDDEGSSAPSETGEIDYGQSQEITKQDAEKKTVDEAEDIVKEEAPEADKEDLETEAINTANLGLPPSWNFDGPRQSRELTTSVKLGTYLDITDEEPDRPFDLVMIHGLGADHDTTWGSPEWSSAFHEKYPRCRILSCDYWTNELSVPVYSLKGLRAHAMEVLSDLMYYREEMGFSPDVIRPIVFVAHDIGGIILKLALWMASLEYGTYRRILDSVRVVVFLGTPHRATSRVLLEDQVAKLVVQASPQSLPVWRLADNVKSLTQAVIWINTRFEKTNLSSLLEIISVISTEDAATAIFDSYTTTFGTAHEKIIERNVPHKELSESPDLDDFYPAINRALSTYPGKTEDLSLDSMRCFRLLSSTSSLILPLRHTSDRFKPINEHEILQQWLESYGTDLLYIYGSSRLSEASDHILHSLVENNKKRSTKDLILTFTLSKYDDRRNNIVSMLATLLAGCFLHTQNMTDFLVYEQLTYYRSWTMKELIVLWNTVLGHNDHEGIIVVISGIDQCDSSKDLFLQDLALFLSLTEHRIKILITGTDDDSVKKTLGDYRSIDLQSVAIHDVDKAVTTLEINRTFVNLVYENPVFSRFKTEVTQYLAPFNTDRESLRLAFNYLKHNPEIVQREEASKSWPTTITNIFEQVFKNIREEDRQRVQDVMYWVFNSLRPFALWELGTALFMERSNHTIGEEEFGKEVEQFASEVEAFEHLFQGLLVVESHDVVVAHAELRIFLDSVGTDCWYHISKDATRIVEVSLKFFGSTKAQERIHNRYLHKPAQGQSAVFPQDFDDHFLPGEGYFHRYSFGSYAAHYWPKHYLTLPEATRTSVPAAFLKNKAAYRAWEQVLWWTDNPVKRRVRTFISPMPLLANLGLQDLIPLDEDTDQIDRSLALAEAARNGHIEIVRALLKYGDYSKHDMQTVLNTGGSSENEDMLIELVQYCADSFPKEFKPKVAITVTEPEATEQTAETAENQEVVDGAEPATEVTESTASTIEHAATDEEQSTNTAATVIEATEQPEEIVEQVPSDAQDNTNDTEHSSPDEAKATVANDGEAPLEPLFPVDTELMCRAMAFSHERLARTMLELGAPIQITSVKGMTPLDFAVRQRNPNVLKLIIEAGAELGIKTTLAYHPLHLAVIYGMPEMVQQLVDAGVNLDLKNTSDSTATYLGAWHRHYKAIEPIVKAGADLSNDTTGLWTPLTCCARRDTRKAAKILLENGANADVIGFDEWTPLRSATVQGYLEFSQLLLEYKADPNSKSGAKGAPIICEVARQGKLPLMKVLVEAGADFKAFDFNLSSPLLNAAVCGKTEVCEYLCDLGADLDGQDITGFNPIALASYSSYPETIKLLHKKGVDIHAETKTKWTPLHYAYDDAETTKVLLDCGADIDHISEHYTPLILAATFNKHETLKVLLAHDPPPKLEVPYDNPDLNPGLTALGIAATNEYTDIVRTLLEAGCNPNHQSTNGSFALEYPVRDNNLELLRLLLEYNPDQTLVDNQGNTALHCVVATTSLEIAKALVRAGAPLEIVNKKGYTPIGEAISEAHLEITKYLIGKGANLNFTGGECGGPLHCAARNNSFEFVTTLVEAKADVNLLDPALGTPVQAACSRWPEGDGVESNKVKEKILRYLIEDCKVNLHIEGGNYGCALNSLSAYASPELVKLALDQEVKVSVPDVYGRQAIHFAASNGLQNFLHIHAAGGDIEARDLSGRTVLHWATLAGNVDVMERILSLNRSLLDERDIDGWTPLHWACRGAGTAINERSMAVKKSTLELLLKRGADPNLVAKGGGGSREWSCLSISKYNGGEAPEEQSVKEHMEWIVGELKERSDGTFDEEAAVNQSKKATNRSEYCDSCLMTIWGYSYKCKLCLNSDLCTKCYQSVHLIHPADHEFTEEGPEFPEEEKPAEDEKKDEDTDKKDDDDDSSSDSSGDDDKPSQSKGKENEETTAEEEIDAAEQAEDHGEGNSGRNDEKSTGKGKGKGKEKQADTDTDSDTESDDEA